MNRRIRDPYVQTVQKSLSQKNHEVLGAWVSP